MTTLQDALEGIASIIDERAEAARGFRHHPLPGAIIHDLRELMRDLDTEDPAYRDYYEAGAAIEKAKTQLAAVTDSIHGALCDG